MNGYRGKKRLSVGLMRTRVFMNQVKQSTQSGTILFYAVHWIYHMPVPNQVMWAAGSLVYLKIFSPGNKLNLIPCHTIPFGSWTLSISEQGTFYFGEVVSFCWKQRNLAGEQHQPKSKSSSSFLCTNGQYLKGFWSKWESMDYQWGHCFHSMITQIEKLF